MFVQQPASRVWGVWSGFDRLRFRGTVRLLAGGAGRTSFGADRRVLFQDFGAFAQDLRDPVQVAAKAGKTPVCWSSPAADNEPFVRKILAQEGAAGNGLAAALKTAEVCQGFELCRNRAAKRLDPAARTRTCLHGSVCWQDHRPGLTQARIQTWRPLSVHAALNGREWLSRQRTQAQTAFQRRDNCFPWASGFRRAPTSATSTAWRRPKPPTRWLSRRSATAGVTAA